MSLIIIYIRLGTFPSITNLPFGLYMYNALIHSFTTGPDVTIPYETELDIYFISLYVSAG